MHVLPPGDPEGEGPLGIGAYFAPGPQHCLMSWEHIQRVVAQDDLDYLIRHSECETRYLAWGEGIRKEYGGLENYVRQVRLGWKEEELQGSAATGSMSNGNGNHPKGEVIARIDDPTTFFSDVVAKDATLVKVVPNDWPYAMPAECGHMVVWCKRQILDKVLFEDKDTPFPEGPIREAVFAAINFDGIRGLSGNQRRIPSLGFKTREFLRQSPEAMAWLQSTSKGDLKEEEEVALLAERAQSWAGRYIDAYVKKQWPEEKWETAYFCNPPHLRTVPGLSHFQ